MPRPFFDFNHDKKMQEIIRVNHAGEFGAKRIYQGQIKYTTNHKNKKILQHMLEQEKEHLDYFSEQIKNGKARPTFLMPIWDIGGYLMGAISAKLNIKTAMIVTENVESIIESHYSDQINYIERYEPKNSMLKKIEKFKKDEVEHKNVAINITKEDNSILSKIAGNYIKNICKIAIYLSKKI